MIRHLLIGGLLIMGLTAKVNGQLNVPVDFCWGERGVFTEWHSSSTGSTRADLVAVVPEGTEAEPQPLAGKIYLVGSIRTSTEQVLTIKRLNADGTEDVSFGDSGWMFYPPGFKILYLKAAKFDSKHRLVISGSQGAVNGMKGFVMRLNLDGTPDTSFAGTGVFTSTFGNGQSQFVSMTLGDDDSMLLAGFTETVGNANDELLLARISSAGAVSAQFTEAGNLVFDANEYYEHVVRTTTGEYLALRYEGTIPIRISRRSENLTELATAVVPVPSGYFTPSSYGMIPVEDGKVVIALSAHNTPEGIRRSILVRLNSDLTLDTTFGNGGVSEIVDLTVDSYDISYLFFRGVDGSFYLAPASNKHFSIFRWNAHGMADHSFGKDGLLKVSIPGNEIYNSNYLYDAAFTNEGDIIFAGENRYLRNAGSFSALKLWNNVAAEKQEFCDDVVALPQSGFIRPGGSARVLQFEVVVSGTLDPHSLTGASFSTSGTTKLSDITLARLYYGLPGGDPLEAVQVATTVEPGEVFSFADLDVELTHGVNNFWLVYTLDPSAEQGNHFDAELISITLGEQVHEPSEGDPSGHVVAANLLAEWDLASFDPAVSSTVQGVAHVNGINAGELKVGPGMDLVADSMYAGAMLGVNWPAGAARGSTDYIEASVEVVGDLSVTYTSARYSMAFDTTWDYLLPGTIEVRASSDGFASSVEIAKHAGSAEYEWVIEQKMVDQSLASLGTVSSPSTVSLRWYPYHDPFEYGAEEYIGGGLTNMPVAGDIVGEGSNVYLFGNVNSPHANVLSISRQSPAAARVAGGTATFRVYLDKPVSGLVTSDFAFAGGNPDAAIAGVEAVGVAPSAQWDVTVTLPAQDAVVRLDMSGSGNAVPAVAGLPYTHGESYIVDTSLVPEVPAPTVTLSASVSSISEDGGVATVTASLSFVASEDTVIELGTDGTAGGNDYTLSTTTVSIPAGQLSGSATITAVLDGTDELDETVVVAIASVSGGDGARTGEPHQVTVTIIDGDDMPLLSMGSASLVEGNSGSSPMVFTVKLNPASALPVSVRVVTSAQTANASEDYQTVDSLITFAPGETSKTVEVQIYGDTIDELNESFHLVFNSPVNATLTNLHAVGTILDDDDSIAPWVLSIERSAPSSEQTSASSVSFKVTFSENVKNVDIGDFSLSGSSVTADGSTATIASVVAENGAEATEDNVWIVTVEGINKEGTLFLNVEALPPPP